MYVVSLIQCKYDKIVRPGNVIFILFDKHNCVHWNSVIVDCIRFIFLFKLIIGMCNVYYIKCIFLLIIIEIVRKQYYFYNP